MFLIDGSGSISFHDFAKMLNFVKAVMSQFQKPSTQVCPWEREGQCAGRLWGLVVERPRFCSGGLGSQPLQFPQFSLMQFSNKFREHFTFREFTHNSNPLALLDSVDQLGGYTHTATAIRMVT